MPPTDLTAPQPRAFISYAHRDRGVADALAFGLHSRGCEVWVDEGELHAGDSLIERLAEGIQEADCVIALISRNSVDSHWCRLELSMAIAQEVDLERFGVRKVIPIRVGKVEMPRTLAGRVFLEAKRARPHEIVPRLWEDIRHHTDGAGASEAAAPSEADLSYARGVNLYDKGELDAASRELRNASQESHHAAALLLGTIFFDRGQIAQAASEWQFAAGCTDDEISIAAIVNFGRLIATQEFDAEVRTLADARGALIGERSFEDAERMWLSAANSGHRDAAWGWIGLGRLREGLAERGVKEDLAGAEDAFGRAASSAHSESRAYALLKLGRAHWKLGKVDHAISVFEVGAGANDKDLAAWCTFELGRIYWQCEKDDDAGHWWYRAATSGHPDISRWAQEAIDDPSSTWRAR